MTTNQITRVILICDGCATEHGAPDGHPSATEARAAAYADGWRFPPQLRADGQPGTSASDACPQCLPNWQPQKRVARSGYRSQSGDVRKYGRRVVRTGSEETTQP